MPISIDTIHAHINTQYLPLQCYIRIEVGSAPIKWNGALPLRSTKVNVARSFSHSMM